jgi:arylsulfatase A-like enzyme
MELTATMIAAAGGKPDPQYPLDGEDLTSVLSRKRDPFDRTFFWRTARQGAMRSGTWKYLRDAKGEFLFDLATDEREQADHKKSRPEVLVRLRDEFKRWESGVESYPKT